MTKPFPLGTLARTTRPVLTMRQGQPWTYPQGFEFEVEDYVSAEEAESGKAFYWGSHSGGCNNITVDADVVELVRTRAQQAARKLPDLPALTQLISHALIGEEGIYETSKSGGSVEAFARTAEGLPYGFRVRVEAVWDTDD